VELQSQSEELRAQGLGVAAISYDSEEVLAAFAAKRGISDLSLLSDDDSSVIRAFGIYNHVAEEGLGPNADDPGVKADVRKYVSTFGAEEVPRHVYKRRLADALDQVADWGVWPGDGSVPGAQVLAALEAPDAR